MRPFRGSSVADTVREVVSRHPPAASSLRPELPPGWDRILNLALAKDRSRRYQSATDLFQAIETLRSPAHPARVGAIDREPDPVFGRELELRKLNTLLDSAVSGSGRFVFSATNPASEKRRSL